MLVQTVLRVLLHQSIDAALHFAAVAIVRVPALCVVALASGDVEAVVLPDNGGIAEQGQHLRLVGLRVAGHVEARIALRQERADGVIIAGKRHHAARVRVHADGAGIWQSNQRGAGRQRNEIFFEQFDEIVAASRDGQEIRMVENIVVLICINEMHRSKPLSIAKDAR
ncbi:hypothetical protein COLU111180_18190 [Cohnella lubricantis]